MLVVAGSLLAALMVLSAVPAAWAVDVQTAVTVDYEVLRMALRRHLEAQRAAALELWRSADGCGTFTMSDPTITAVESRVKISGPGFARVGVLFFGLFWANVSWTGQADIVVRPEVGADWQLRMRDLDVRLYDRSGRPSIATRLFALMKGWSEAQLSTFAFDLSA